MTRYDFTAGLFRWTEGNGVWFFVALPPDISDAIEATDSGPRAGLGSVPVEVTVGSTRWTTSIFPDSKRATYVLPMKKAVREAEGLTEDEPVEVQITVRPAAGR